jgi:hypothetical protein
MLTQACYQMAPQISDSANSKETPAELDRAKVNCQFVSVDTLKSIIKNQIGLPSGDVPIVGSSTMSLVEYGTKLGKGDLANGVADDASCGALKYKLAMQVMVDACTEALNQDNTFTARLFPNGTSDYEKLFQTFLGRSPSAEESAALDQLNGRVSGSVFPAAACGAVAASLESLSRT